MMLFHLSAHYGGGDGVCPLFTGVYEKMGWFGPVFLYIVFALAIVGAFTLIKSLAGKKKEENPIDILKKRYAKREITKEEFEQMKKEL